MQTFIIAIYILLNIISFGLYAYDKIVAKSGWWRISEKSLLTVSILGGCFGGTLARYLLRHKTQHTRFILVNWIADAVYLFCWFCSRCEEQDTQFSLTGCSCD